MAEVIAFIPVRGGSKSIPMKNIREFCGKPLVYWVSKALQATGFVDKIIIATDSALIAQTVQGFKFNKLELYARSAKNASDTASTESVMLEYIQYAQLADDTVFILMQATSPLTESIHLEEAFVLYQSGPYDSLLTCVRSYRFFWQKNGMPSNYNYLCRPRRQDFSGSLMENGAFYINTVANILQTGNRLGGRIGIYEMPEYTALELDTEYDWGMLESLKLKQISADLVRVYKPIRLFLTDVDGVLTDGGMYYSAQGDEMKKFNTRDGMAFHLLREAGIKTGMITSENTAIVENRASKLKIDYLYQGQIGKGKLEAALDICQKEGITLDEVAYIGDDLNCLELLRSVGCAACPSDAMDVLKGAPSIRVLCHKGGEGAVRELAEYVIDKNKTE